MPRRQTNPPQAIAVCVKNRSALTLLELLVVLVILAIVATVAVQSLQPRVDNQKFESASRLLNEIKTSSIGPIQKYQVDGTPLISGFVADVGRFPLVESPNIELGESPILSELWDPQSELGSQFPFQFRPGPSQPVDYSKVRLPCGWRGPYLQIPIGSDSLIDPWGRVPETMADDRGELMQLQIMVPIISTQTEPQRLTAELTTGKVEVTGKVLLDNPENAMVQVALLTPDPNSSLTTLIVLDDEDEQPDSFLFRNVPIGLRAIVVDADGRRQTKYVQVTHNGAIVCFDFEHREMNTTGQIPASADNQ
jgi:prepilin-type N-terminal cleavage/methylation domain-containing protein